MIDLYCWRKKEKQINSTPFDFQNNIGRILSTIMQRCGLWCVFSYFINFKKVIDKVHEKMLNILKNNKIDDKDLQLIKKKKWIWS